VGGIGFVLSNGSVKALMISAQMGQPDPAAVAAVIGTMYLLFFAAFLPAAFLYQALTRNAVYNATVLEGGHRFTSTVSAPMLLWIAVSNMVVVVASLFLMLPWAQIRMARYLAAHTGYHLGGPLDDFVASQQSAGHAVGDAFADFEGIGAGLPL
jgi:uncharacterized membrane protein YjgN (DUF898 family)